MELKTMNIEELIEKLLKTILDEEINVNDKKYGSVWLSEEGKTSVRQFLYFCINSSKTGDLIPYNVLIESFDIEKGNALAVKMADVGMKILKCNQRHCTETEFNQYVMENEEKNPSIAVITDMLKEDPDNWEEIFDRLELNKKIIKIYVKSDQNNTRLENHSFFRWRFLNLHVQKNKMTCEDILDYSLYLLKKEGYSFDEDFEKALKENIVTVYPRENTLKKEEEFVFDTILGIKRIMRSTGVDTKILKVKDIPPYSKNDDTLSEEPVELIPPNYEIKNIMVLALSTLTNKKKSSFEYREGEEILFSDSDCKYQLEPITKYFIETHKGESINIIELCTDEVINSKDDEGDTAKLFFENRIQEYNNKKGYNCELNFIQVEIDENNTDKGLVKAVNTLIDIKKNNKVNHIWIDTHGGFRDVTFTLNSLISLLKIYDVNPNRIFGVRFSGPGDKSINQIVDQENSFKMSNFVSGMNEFIKYGSAELLADYYSSEDDLQTNKIVKAIREVSDGTKLCDPGMYLKSLDNLGQSINEYNEIEKPFDVFVRYIKDDYGLLLDNSRRRNIDVIERCYKKGMYQQALTFIESLMPDDYVNKGFVSCDSGQRSNIQASKETQRKTYVSDEYYIFDTFISLKINYYTRDRADSIKTDKGFTDNEMKDYGSLQMIKYFSGENVDYTFNGQNPMPENNSQRRHNTRDFNIIVNNRNKNRDDLFNLFRLHYAIKQIRNITNHSKTNMFRPTLEEISKALNKYIELAKIVLE